MNWRNTLWLALAAAVLAGFILVFERPARLARSRTDDSPPLLPGFDPGAVRVVEIQGPGGPPVVLVRSNGLWELEGAARRPAQSERVDGFLRRLAGLRARPILSREELLERPTAASEFGLSPALVRVALLGPWDRMGVQFGATNVFGTQVFCQVDGVPGIFTADARVVEDLPLQAEGWRDTTLFPLGQLDFDRVRVAGQGAAFTLVRGVTNGAWELAEPRPARADSARVDLLLRQLSLQQVQQFLPPSAAPAPEFSALRPPRLTLTLARGSNEVYALEFGAALTNSAWVLARRPGEEDLLAVPGEAFDLLRISYKQLLDSRILRFDPSLVREVVFEGPESFRVTWTTNGWRLLPADVPADEPLLARLLVHLARLEVLDVAKEVVTPLDLPTYGLAPPSTRITLRATPGVAQSELGVLETGAFRDNQVFARVPEEGGPVYALNPAHVLELPDAGWRLRDRGLWRFEPGAVNALTVRDQGLEWTIRHGSTNHWIVPPGWRDEVNPFALEEAVFQLGQTRVLSWIGVGDEPARVFGTTVGPQLDVEFRATPPLPPLRLAFGKSSPAGHRYGSLTTADGVRLTFELPGAVYDALWREIGLDAQPGDNRP